jgi:ADP-ribose pyrophosphatase YjhB (NUDIX family)
LLFFVSLQAKNSIVMKKFWILGMIALLFSACQESLEDRCERDAKEYTRKHCPTAIDENTVIDSLVFERATHTIHYYYKLTGVADEEQALKDVDAVNVLKQGLKNATAVKVYKDAKYRFAYTYRSSKDPKKILLDVVFTDKDY